MGDQYEEEPGCCSRVWFFHTLLRLLIVKLTQFNNYIQFIAFLQLLIIQTSVNSKLGKRLNQVFLGSTSILGSADHHLMILTNIPPFKEK